MPIDSKGEYYCDGAIPRLAIDFDGLLYPGGKYVNEYSFQEPARKGAIEWLKWMAEDYELLIYTSRMCCEPHTVHTNHRDKENIARDIRRWLCREGISPVLLYKNPRIIVYPAKYGKPSCKAYLDDNAVRINEDMYPVGPFDPYWKVVA